MAICLVYEVDKGESVAGKDTVTITLISLKFVQYMDFRKKEIWQVLLITWINPCMTEFHT